MKKILFSALILSLLLATLTACGAETQQPTTPEPAPQADQVEPEKPELPAEPNPEPLADLEPATEPEPVVDVEPEAEPQEIYTFDDCNEIVYATSQVNLRSGPSTDYDKVGSLKTADSVTRTGIGIDQFENWSRVVLSDGTEVYVNNNYISTTKPVTQQSTAKPSSSTPAAKPSSQSSGASSGSTAPSGGGGASGGSSGDANKEWAESRGQGLAGILGYDGGVQFEEGAAEGVYGDPSVRVNMG